jgi:hypothetical protein
MITSMILFCVIHAIFGVVGSILEPEWKRHYRDIKPCRWLKCERCWIWFDPVTSERGINPPIPTPTIDHGVCPQCAVQQSKEAAK